MGTLRPQTRVYTTAILSETKHPCPERSEGPQSDINGFASFMAGLAKGLSSMFFATFNVQFNALEASLPPVFRQLWPL